VWELPLVAENRACDQDQELVSKCYDERQRVDYAQRVGERLGEDIQIEGAGGGHHLVFAYVDRMRVVEALAQGSRSRLSIGQDLRNA